MTEKKRQLLEEMSCLSREEEKPIFLPVAAFLIELNYLPERRKVKDFSLAFKHRASKRIIAQFDMRQIKKQRPFPLLSIKFFGVKDTPIRYTQALVREIERGMYIGPLRSEIEKNWCGRCTALCTGGGVGYYHQYPDGAEVLRCGAYPIPIPDVTQDDVEEMKWILLQQHTYFCTLSQS